MISKLARSPHRAVRALAASDVGRCDPWDPSSPESRVVARRWLADDRAAFVAAVRGRFASGDDATRIRTTRLIAAIGAAGVVEPELVTMLKDESCPRVAATAARALGELRTPSARDALTKSLAAKDARLRANALESLARSSREALAVLVEFKSDRHHRVRGAAVRAELESNTVASLDDVLAMLDDPRAEHRLAGVWVAERALTGHRDGSSMPGSDRVLDRLSEIARSESSANVQARALRCVRRVLMERAPTAQAESQIEPAANPATDPQVGPVVGPAAGPGVEVTA